MSRHSSTLAVICALSAPVALAAQATVDGIVFDSVARRPLSGASVQFVGTGTSANTPMLSATADSAGRFRLVNVPRGQYLAGFFHAAVDSLGLELPPLTVAITSNRHRVELAIPSPKGLASVFCPQEPLTDSTAMIVGHVRESGTERAVTNARVHADWTVTAIGRGTIESARLNASSETTAPGWFALCGVPAETPLLVRATLAGDTTGYQQLELTRGGLGRLTLHLGRANASAAKGRLVGTILDQSGNPLATAHVFAWQVTASATTNEQGQFVLDDLPAGTRTVEVRSIGREPLLRVVDLVAGETTRLDVRMERVITLEKVETRAEVAYSKGLMKFEHHRRTSAGGYFVRPSDLGSVAGQDLIALARAGPNVEVTISPQDKRWYLYMRRPTVLITEGGNVGRCIPEYYLDGVRTLFAFDDLVTYLSTDRILALEMYTHFNQVPPDYQIAPLSPCGLVSIWTRPFGSALKKP